MRKNAVVFALILILGGGIISFLINEKRFEEEKLYEWKPKENFTLDPNKENATFHIFFFEIVHGMNIDFRKLFDRGEVPAWFLELNITASGGPVRVIVGRVLPEPVYTGGPYYYYKQKWLKIFLNCSGTCIVERLTFNATNINVTNNIVADARWLLLEISNEGVDPVRLSGDVMFKAEMPKVFYPFLGLGIFICLLGSSLMVYGILVKPKPSRKRVRAWAFEDFGEGVKKPFGPVQHLP